MTANRTYNFADGKSLTLGERTLVMGILNVTPDSFSDEDVRALISFLNDEETVQCATVERSFLARVEGGCQVPVGVYATSAGEGMIQAEAVIASVDGSKLYRDKLTGPAENCEKIGRELADKLLAMGGLQIMQEIGLLMDR